MAQARLSRGLLSRVLLRSFLLQASWNFEGLQGLGFLYAAAPALRRLHRGEARVAAYRRHLAYFNTHPFLASPALGTALALEEGGGGSDDPDSAEFKQLVMAPYAAMGDAFFWGGIRPLAAGIALFFALRGSLWAPLVYLGLFNVPHLWLRSVGLWQGYRRGVGMTEEVRRWHLPDMAMHIKGLTVVLLGALCAYLSFLGLRSTATVPLWGVLVLPLVVVLAWLARKGVSALGLSLSLAALILAFH